MKLFVILWLLFSLLGCITVTEQNGLRLESDAIEKAESRVTLGLGYLENGNMPKARENLEKALEHAPEYSRAMLAIAHYYDVVGETEKALEAYDQVISQHNDNGQVLNNYGAFLCKLGFYKKADNYFNQAVEQSHYYRIAESYENAGICAVKHRSLHKAQQYFSRALDHEPQRIRSILHLSKLEIDAGNFTNARSRLLLFHQINGTTKTSLNLLAELELRSGNRTLADKYYSLISTPKALE